MSHSLRSKSFAVCSLVFASAGLIAIACGSDKATNSDNPALTPGAGSDDPSNSAGTTGNGTEPGAVNPTTPANPTPGNPSGNNEGQTGELPIAPGETPGETPDETGNNPPVTLPPATITANCAAPEGAVPNLSLQPLGSFNLPIFVSGVPGDDSKLVVVEKSGAVRVLLNGEVQQTPFIDVSGMLNNNGTSERGLLGMAFHPDFQTNGLFYLHFSSGGGQGLPALGDTVVAEFTANADRSAADLATRRVILTIAQPQANHNGGMITFGADRMLYLGFGDGGAGNDNQNHGPIGNGQNLDTLLAKILRIDPLGRDVNNSYGIPAGNLAEVTEQQARPEIWAYGVRNPWRFSFDACNGDLYIGDVGQDNVEEVDFVPAAADTRLVPAGRNFGWRIMEGPGCRTGGTEPCNAQTMANLTLPVDSYPIGTGAGGQRGSVTGGYVYRGSSIPGLRGTYIYADYVRSTFFRFRIQGGAIADKVEITTQMRPTDGSAFSGPSSFGTDNLGELYVASLTPGAVYRVVAAP